MAKVKVKLKNLANRLESNKWFCHAYNIFFIALGTFLMGVAYGIFLTPNNITPSGFSGLSNIISKLIYESSGFHLSPAIIYLAFNIVLFIFAIRNMGIKFCIYAGIGIGLYSLFMQFIDFTVFLSSDLLLCSLVGNIIMGIGLGLIVRSGGSTGGTDMLSIMINRFFPSASTGFILFVVNTIVVSISISVYGLTNALYAIIGIWVGAKVTDGVIDGVRAVRAYYIISDKNSEIKHEIQNTLRRGVTDVPSKGFHGQDRDMLICLVRSNQVAQLKDIIKRIDPTSFVFCTTVKEALGNGFYTKPEKTKLSNLMLFLHKPKKQAKGLEPQTLTSQPQTEKEIINENTNTEMEIKNTSENSENN